MNQFFGCFVDNLTQHDSLELIFTQSSMLSEQIWRNHRLSAHFVANYFANLLPIDENESQGEERIKAIQTAVSYIGNELLENAMKFNEFSRHERVQFGIHFVKEIEIVTPIIFTKNSITCEKVEQFQGFIEELLSADPNELYIRQVEKAVESEQDEASGLGLLTIINDYSAKLGWKFEPKSTDPQVILVTTMAQIVV